MLRIWKILPGVTVLYFCNCGFGHTLEVRDARRVGSSDIWSRRVFDKAERLNKVIGRHTRAGPLKLSEVKATAKSVAKWTWDKYTGHSINRGVMEMDDTEIPLINKQRLAARRTHEVRRKKTVERIMTGVRLLLAAKASLNRCSVAKASGCTRQTVARYWEEVERLADRCKPDLNKAERLPAIEEKLSEALTGRGNVITLASLARSTGIDRRKIKTAYSILFDP